MHSHIRMLSMTLRHSGPVLAVPVLAWLLAVWTPDVFERITQEDGPVEWITFWAFAAAGALALTSPGLRGTPADAEKRGPLTRLFLILFGLGALFVALEEISWGQRLIGYRPPDVFLRDNFQQELNLHNLAGAGTRGALLMGLLFAFGVAYPLLCRIPPASRWLAALGVPTLPLTLLPGFAALLVVYAVYPWEYTGEWVELGAGIGFLIAALVYREHSGGWQASAALAAVMAAGILTPLGQASLTDPVRRQIAAIETAALAEDFATKRYRSRCGVHKRVYTFVTEYGGSRFEDTAFGTLEPSASDGALAGDERDLERHRYFLDPWNLPYWIRHECSRDRQTSTVYVYSFGANRRRDSTADQLVADDVGAWVSRPPSR
ncbi:MAG: hypothetical protein AB7I04_07590 [Pseudomonadales bacterium]